MQEVKPLVMAAGVVVVRLERGVPLFLLLERKGTKWDLCQGELENGESETAAALRECREETGLDDLKIDPEFRHSIMYLIETKTNPQRKRVVFFLGMTRTSEIRISVEHTAYKWAHLSEALPLIHADLKRGILLMGAIWIAVRALNRQLAAKRMPITSADGTVEHALTHAAKAILDEDLFPGISPDWVGWMITRAYTESAEAHGRRAPEPCEYRD